MTCGDILNYVRFLLNETDSQGRFDDASLIMAINQGSRRVSLHTRFPEYQLTTTTPSSPTLQEYALPEIIDIKRVYLAGQSLVKSSIPTLEGDQILLYDQTGANYQPQWKIAAVATYPVASGMGFPAPIATPYYPGMRPTYYLRGASVLGIQPPPAGGALLQVEGVAFPAPLVNKTDLTIYSNHYLESIAQAAGAAAMQSDQNREGKADFEVDYARAIGELDDWLASFTTPNPVQPLTYRTMFSQGACQGNPGPWRSWS